MPKSLSNGGLLVETELWFLTLQHRIIYMTIHTQTQDSGGFLLSFMSRNKGHQFFQGRFYIYVTFLL